MNAGAIGSRPRRRRWAGSSTPGWLTDPFARSGSANPQWAAIAVSCAAALLLLLGLADAGLLAAALAWLAIAAAVATGFGLVVSVLAAVAVRRFSRAAHFVSSGRPAISVLRPLHGDEPGLDRALASLAAQDYPDFQIVFGVQDAADPALAAVARLRADHPALDVAIVVNTCSHGPNPKVSNLINMLPLARHDMLVFSDSDLHVAPTYLRGLVSALARPGTGLVTTLCTGLPTVPGVAARLAALQITHSFLPGALLSRALGRQDCLGTTMALHRDTLARAGGLPALVGHLADDNLLGRHVRQLGLGIGLAATVPATAARDASLAMLWQHELRWARTIRALAPAAFAASAVQFPLAWALAACLCSGATPWAVGLLALAWLVRAAAARSVSRALSQPAGLGWAAAGLLPARDVLSVLQIVASFLGGRVLWQGHVLRADAGPAPVHRGVPDAVQPPGVLPG